MTTKRPALLVVLLLICGPWCTAEEIKPLTMDECISIAMESNPLILSTVDYYRASLARIKQARALPQPVFGYASDFQPSLFNFRGALESYTGLAFSFDFPTKISARGKIAGKEAEGVLAENDLLKIEIIFQVKEAFFGLLLAQEKHRYAEENLELAEDFAQKTELKFEAGEVARVEALRARVEAAGAMTQVRAARNDARVARAVLNFLLARREMEPLEVEGDLKMPPMSLDLESLKETALEFRPEVRAVDLALEREELARGLAKQAYIPDFEIAVARHKVESEPSTWEVAFALPVPLYFWQPKQGEIAEALANIEALKKESQHWSNSIALDVEQSYRDAVTAQDQIDLFERDILTQAEEVYNMFFFSYQEGEIGGIELIAARRTLMDARRGYADAQHDYAVALSALQKAIGQDLQGGGS